MEDRFRETLREALLREGLSATDLSRDVGMDKSYFVDLLAGRKKTVSVIAFMLVVRRLGLDPWDVAGIDAPKSARKLEEPNPALSAPPPPAAAVAAKRLALSFLVEEDA